MNETEPSPSPLASAKCVPGIAQSLGMCVLFYFLCGAVFYMLSVLQQIGGVSLDMNWSGLVVQVVAWPLILWAGLRWSKVTFPEACRLTRFPIRIVPALLIASFGAAILLMAAVTLIPMSEFWKSTFQSVAGSNKLALFLSQLLVAPLAEELFFRGWVLHGYLGPGRIRILPGDVHGADRSRRSRYPQGDHRNVPVVSRTHSSTDRTQARQTQLAAWARR